MNMINGVPEGYMASQMGTEPNDALHSFCLLVGMVVAGCFLHPIIFGLELGPDWISWILLVISSVLAPVALVFYLVLNLLASPLALFGWVDLPLFL